MSSAPAMTATSYAILGLLAIKPWTTHELVQQVVRPGALAADQPQHLVGEQRQLRG